MAKTAPFQDFAPDLTPLGTNVSQLISGCIPQLDGYGPFDMLQAFTQPLPGPCRGYFFARRADGSIAIFAGTATRLYLLDNTSFAWTDVSQGATDYSSLVTTAEWQFRQFNDLVIAVQGAVVPQKFILASSTAFEDLGGSPPQASHIAIVNRFVVLTGLTSNGGRVQWSDIDAPETWTAGVGLSDYQDLPDGGTIHSVTGGDNFGLIFQDEPIRMLVYAPGSAVTFQITKLSENDPIDGQYAAIQAGDRVFFHTAQGFKMVTGGGGKPIPIGKERVDRFFAKDVDTGNYQLFQAAADPRSTRVYWGYKSGQGTAGLIDKVLVYDWAIGEAGRWSILSVSIESLAALAKPGLTLEQLDAIAATPLSVVGAADNGAGLIRLELDAISNANFAIAGQNFIVVQGVTGTTEANGTWAVTIIDATHIDLIGSTFTNAYISGGAIGGSLDALPFSLDSVSVSSIAALSAFDDNHKLGFFNGDTMEAIIETTELDAEGTVVFCSAVRPLTDCADVVVSLGTRMTAQAAVAYTAERALGVTGSAPARREARYVRARCRFPQGSDWTYARGIQPEIDAAGDR